MVTVEPEAPDVRKAEMEAGESGLPAVCKTETDDVPTHALSPAPAAPPAPSADEQIVVTATTTAWERREHSNDGYPTSRRPIGWGGMQEVLSWFIVPGAAAADDAASNDDAPEDPDCVHPVAGVQPNAAAAPI